MNIDIDIDINMNIDIQINIFGIYYLFPSGYSLFPIAIGLLLVCHGRHGERGGRCEA